MMWLRFEVQDINSFTERPARSNHDAKPGYWRRYDKHGGLFSSTARSAKELL